MPTASPSTASLPWSASPADQRALATAPDWSSLQGLEQLWSPLADRFGEAIAVEAPHAKPPESLSYQDLHRRIEQAAAGFAALGVQPGDVVAVFAENGPRWLVADQGVMRAGAADAVRGSAAPAEELRYILADSGAVGLVVESRELLRRLALDAAGLAPLRFVVLLEDACTPDAGAATDGDAAARNSAARTSAAVDGDAVQGVAQPPTLSWAELLERGASSPVPPLPDAGPDRLATLLYTSGTTGTPKGVPLTHGNLLHQLRTLGVAVQPEPGERVLSVLPIWHAYERSAEYFLLSRGCRQTYTTLRQLRGDLQKVRPQYLISVPRLWEALMAGFEDALATMPASRRTLLRGALANSRAWALARRTASDLALAPVPAGRRLQARVEALLRTPLHALAEALFWPKVRQQLVGGCLQRAISGGGALALHVDGFFEAIGIELLVGYGLTETSPVLTCRRPWCNRRGSAGQPLAGTEIRIVDPQSRAPLPAGERGLVLARGPQVMTGYFHKPEATARVIDAEGWFDTGDLGQLLPDGSLVLTGRAKDTIVLSSGENIEPGPLEECLVACELVEQVMLVGQDRKALGALVVAKADPLAAFAREQGLQPAAHGPEASAGGAEAALLKALTSLLNRHLQARPGARPDERLAGVALVEPFTIENGLLTQTLKQRRDRIAERDAAAIAALYGDPRP